ncbi:MAG: hypothetical protein Q8P59_07690 [Dehalococcoidia bacterium]|nr:hypothetical protein [Dehalococcoidia bacterium]
MSEGPTTEEHRCDKCGKGFTSMMRLQHHVAAEHAVKTLKDIKTTRDIRHGMKGGVE